MEKNQKILMLCYFIHFYMLFWKKRANTVATDFWFAAVEPAVVRGENEQVAGGTVDGSGAKSDQ